MPDTTKIYAVIDTNVVVSSLFSKDGTSSPALVIRAIFNGAITPLYNDEIIKEYRDVLSRPKFPFNEVLVEEAISAIRYFGLHTERTTLSGFTLPDSDDTVFYEVKMSVNDAYMVTGNTKHFPKEPFVVTPAEMVEILRKKGLIWEK